MGMPVAVQSQVPTIHGAEKHRDVDEANTVKIGGKDEMENHRLMMLKATEGKLRSSLWHGKMSLRLNRTFQLYTRSRLPLCRRTHRKRSRGGSTSTTIISNSQGRYCTRKWEREKRRRSKRERQRGKKEGRKEGRDGPRGVRAKESEEVVEEAGEQQLGSLIKT